MDLPSSMIVVPSVAIKEGTYKTLQITRDHFENYTPKRQGDMSIFLYDSRKLGQVRNYATSPEYPDHGGHGRRDQ